MNWRGYFGIENLNLTNPQRALLVGELERLGPSDHPQPACLCHWRYRLDNDAAIYEALFNFDQLTIAKTKARLGAIFNVDPSTIDHAVTETNFAGLLTQIFTFARGGTDYLRMAIFGGSGSSWADSHSEVMGYLKLNKGAWEG